jgi:septum formation protein
LLGAGILGGLALLILFRRKAKNRMHYEPGNIILASASPRRVELLSSAGVKFQVLPSGIPEDSLPGETPEDHVLRLAREKALDVAQKIEGRFFIGADTVVVSEGEIMGKPSDSTDAERMLRKLSGVPHEVITGFAVYDKEKNNVNGEAVKTKVYFKTLNTEEIRAYIASGCSFDKAGAYAIQGGAAYMIRKIEGSYSNVVGLPLCEVVEALHKAGAICQ